MLAPHLHLLLSRLITAHLALQTKPTLWGRGSGAGHSCTGWYIRKARPPRTTLSILFAGWRGLGAGEDLPALSTNPGASGLVGDSPQAGSRPAALAARWDPMGPDTSTYRVPRGPEPPLHKHCSAMTRCLTPEAERCCI